MNPAEVRFIDLYDRYHKRVANYCGRRVQQHRVDDAVAETFMTAWRRIEDVPEGEAALPWLYSVAYRVVGHQWRGATRRIKLNEKLASFGRAAASGPDELVVMRDETRLALEAVQRLKDIDREILMLSGWEELSHKEIAAVLGITPDAVAHRLQSAKRRLTKEFNKRDRVFSDSRNREGSA